MDGLAGLFGAGVLLLGGLAMLALARRSADGRLKPNGMAGVRTSLTMSSDAAWYAAQTAAAGATSAAGWGAIAFAVLAAVGCALGTRFLRLPSRWTYLIVLVLAWVLAPPVAAWINMGGPSAEAFEPALEYWGWAALPAAAYALSMGMLGFFGPQRPPDAAPTP